MLEAATVFLGRVVGTSSEALVRDFIQTYLAEWNKGVRYPCGIAAMLERLRDRFTLAIVTNTHDADLVPHHLERMGISHLFACIVTSVEVGTRKPDPAIFHRALHLLGVSAERCIFVGDSHEADYMGALSAGIPALLIDPERQAQIHREARLESVFDLECRLADAATSPSTAPAGRGRISGE